ncbi:testis-specific Y-encoded protein 1-like [Bos taurus]|uniref:testis-specific Y-encoded protein 1-like n=1 Tax=Bos taurus TaxID=9913 RepID=UPI0028CB96E0|nr:testis-specific Y-encoded protein 1-like [Bos taurus]
MSRPFTSAPAGDQGQAQEERVRQSEEGGSILGPQTFLIVSPAWTFQPPIVTPGKEATLFRVEAVEDSKALVDEDVVGIEWEFQLLAEDSTKEVEVVTDDERQQGFSQELEEKTVEEQGWERPGGPSELPVLDELQALAALRVELSSEHEKNHRAYIRFMHKSHQRRKSHLAWRSAIIQGIPGFWAKAIMNHPQVCIMISNQDKDFLSYMIDLKVQRYPRFRCKLIFSFWENPYFLNTVIIKKYYLDITGHRACCSTPVHWIWGFERGALSHKLHTRSLKFLNWLSGYNCSELNRIAEIINEDVWNDPLKYYSREEGSSMRGN